MRLILLIFILFGATMNGVAQQTIHIKIISGGEHSPVQASISIHGTAKGYATDSSGLMMIPFESNGAYTLIITATGYETKKIQVIIPSIQDTLDIELEHSEHEMEQVIIQSTRTSRTISNVPTRVETIALEEIDEKTNMRPSNVAMILHESTGIQVQQTSATSGNASIRIQGLDGRYTQLLKDGFPNYGNFASGLSVLEIPPLDLKQVEIIKGPASPLYGGGAIAGVINFISKTPGTKPEYSFILNQSNIGQSNIGAFASGGNKKLGYTLLALYNHSKAYDVDNDEFTEVPLSNEIVINPRFFIYPDENSTIVISNNMTAGTRTGGDVQVIKGSSDASHQYFEKNQTLRNSSSIEWDKKIGDNNRLLARQSFSFFDRTINIPGYVFEGVNYNAYTDVSYVSNGSKHAFVLGGNFIYDRFNEKSKSSSDKDNTSTTGGLYGQHTWDATGKVKLETGLRVDIANYRNEGYSNTEAFVLPRISLLVAFNPQWSSRVGAGMGYKTPSLFTEETETLQYQNLEPLKDVSSEKSYGGTADVNFRTYISDDLVFSFNHMFFYTWINHPLVLENYLTDQYKFVNASEPVQSKGFETNAKFVFRDNFKLFLGYTFTDAQAKYLTGKQVLPLVPRDKLNTALIYEKEGVIKLGVEGYFTGKQYLQDGTKTPSFAEYGFMAEKIFRKFSLFINLENFSDTRQSRYKNVVNGPHLNPVFDQIWTHTEGFVVNGGIKIKL